MLKVGASVKALAFALKSKDPDKIKESIKRDEILYSASRHLNQDSKSYIVFLSKHFKNDADRKRFISIATGAARTAPKTYKLVPKNAAEKHAINIEFMRLSKSYVNEADEQTQQSDAFSATLGKFIDLTKQDYIQNKKMALVKLAAVIGLASAFAWNVSMFTFNIIQKLVLELSKLKSVKTKRGISGKAANLAVGGSIRRFVTVLTIEALISVMSLRILKKFVTFKEKTKQKIEQEKASKETDHENRNINNPKER